MRLLSDDKFAAGLDELEDVLVEQYADGELPPDERRRCEDYFFSAPERKVKLRVAVALRERAERERRPRVAGGWGVYLRVAASLLILFGLGFGVWRVLLHRSDVDEGLLALQASVRERGGIETRVTGLTYAPPTRQRGAPEAGANLERERAGLLLRTAVSKSPSAESYHALGRYFLFERRFDEAVENLDESLRRDPQNGRVHSDLGAALFERGQLHFSEPGQGRGVEELARSLEHLNQALALDGSLLEARFNRALVYQQLLLLPQAAEDWRKYLEADPSSRWADEARQNLQHITEQQRRGSLSGEEIFQNFLRAHESGDTEAAWRLVSSYQGRAGNVVVERLLDAHLESRARGRAGEGRDPLRLLSEVGGQARDRSGEKLFSDLAAYYESASPAQLATVGEARRLMKSGHDGWGRDTAAESLDHFSRAGRLFEAAGDGGEAVFAEYWANFARFRMYRAEESLANFERLERRCAASGYKRLLVRALFGIALAQHDLNELSKAIDYGRRSLALAEQIGDTLGALNAMGVLIEYGRYLRNSEQALGYLQHSLPLLATVSLDPIIGCRHFYYAASALASLGLYDAAVEYQKESVRYADSSGNPSTMSVNHAALGSLYGKLNNYAEALKHINRAIEMAEARAAEPAVQEMIAYSHLLMGHLRRQESDFPECVANCDRAVEIYARLGLPVFLYEAHKGRLLCYAAQRDDSAVRAEIETVLALAERHRDKIFEEETRNNFFDAEQSVYDLAIGFAHGRMNDGAKAFEYSELSRARSLLELLNASGGARTQDGRSLPLDEIRKTLPQQARVVQYAVLEDKLLIWVLSRTGMVTEVSAVGQAELSGKVLDYWRLISDAAGDEAEATRQAKELHDLLLKPVMPALAGAKLVCIVPDKALNHLPFGALVSRSTGRHVIEEFPLVYSPSSTVFVRSSEEAGRKGGPGVERLLSVGNPRFDRRAYASLPDLPSADREAREISAYYDATRTLTGDDARAGVVMEEMAASEVVHLAAHSVLDPRFPERSKLLLAKEPAAAPDRPEGGALAASNIPGLNLKRTRLVVLSACQTATERYYGGEGMIGMARPFIAAGVPLVTASLWRVDADSTAGLMISFHKHRRGGKFKTAEALQQAQLEMLRGQNARLRRPYHWAAFINIGGYVSY